MPIWLQSIMLAYWIMYCCSNSKKQQFLVLGGWFDQGDKGTVGEFWEGYRFARTRTRIRWLFGKPFGRDSNMVLSQG